MTASAPSGWRPSFAAACLRQPVSPSHSLGRKRGLFYCLPYACSFSISPRVSTCSSLVAEAFHYIARSTALRCAAGFVFAFLYRSNGCNQEYALCM